MIKGCSAADTLDTPCARKERLKKNYSLEGLRGVAALIVFLSHVAFGFYPFVQTGQKADLRFDFEWRVWASPLHFVYSGELAVSIFFVLSGYVLSKKYFEDKDQGYLTRSAVKRFVRLGAPVFAAVAVGYMLMAAGAFPGHAGDMPGTFVWEVYRHPVSLPTALKDALYGALLFGRSDYDYVLWTIQLEFFGSMLIFAFFSLFGSYRYRGLVALFVGLMLMLQFPIQGTLLSLFLAGAYLNDDRIVRILKGWGGVTLLVGLYIGGYNSEMPVYSAVASASNHMQSAFGIKLYWPLFYVGLGAVLIVWSVLASRVIDRLLSSRIPVWLGRVSFGMYLLHSLVLGSVGAAVFRTLHPAYTKHYWMAAVLSAGVSLAVSLVCAETFTRIVDGPATRFANYLGRIAPIMNIKEPGLVGRSERFSTSQG